MCTLTWKREASGEVEIYFNRDEKKSRPVAEPPALYEIHGVRFLSPRDPKGGGTWMAVNEFGIAVCLLNKWELDGQKSGGGKSRGQLVWNLASLSSLEDVDSRLWDVEAYPAFTMVVFSPDGERRWDWDGKTLSSGLVKMPVTSSSYCFEEVKAAREAVFESGLRGEEFHASIGEAPSAFSVRMNRPDAQTWSRSRVLIGEKIHWEYFAEQADLAEAAVKTVEVLPRR